MAAFEIEFSEDFLSGLLQTDFDDIAQDALSEAGPILEKSLQISCKNSIDHEGDSELADSIIASKPKKSKNGAWVLNVGPRGYSKVKKYRRYGKKTEQYREYPVSNALKAIWKEYGIPGRQVAKPFMQKACNDIRNSVEKILQETYDRKIGTK